MTVYSLHSVASVFGRNAGDLLSQQIRAFARASGSRTGPWRSIRSKRRLWLQ
jgi:hypothetical protein